MDSRSADLSAAARQKIEIAASQLVGRGGLTRADRDDLVAELTLDLLEHLARHDARRSAFSTFVQLVVEGKSKRILRDRCRDKHACLRNAVPLEAVAGSDDDGTELALAELLDADATAIALGLRRRTRHDTAVLRLDVPVVLARLPPDLRACCTHLMDGRSISELARARGLTRGAFRYHVLAPLGRAFRAAGYGHTRANPEKTAPPTANRGVRSEQDQQGPEESPTTQPPRRMSA